MVFSIEEYRRTERLVFVARAVWKSFNSSTLATFLVKITFLKSPGQIRPSRLKMKSYPSIERASFRTPPGRDLFTFDKIDGSNLRFEWTRKRGWWKFGTRERLFDRTDKHFGSAVDVFLKTMAEPLAKFSYDQKWDPLVVFTEFYGERSFAGLHHPEDEKKLALIDVSPRGGILPPKDFLNIVEKIGFHAPRYLGVRRWNQPFLKMVEDAALEGITLEGVVGKGVERDKLVMFKYKTMLWRDAVRNKYETAVALKLIES